MTNHYKNIQDLTDDCLAAGLRVSRRQVQHLLDKNNVPPVVTVGIARGYSEDVLPWLLKTMGAEVRQERGRLVEAEWREASHEWLSSLHRVAQRPMPPEELRHLSEVQQAIRERDEAIDLLRWHDVADVLRLLADADAKPEADAVAALHKTGRVSVRLLTDVQAPKVPFYPATTYPAGKVLHCVAQLADELIKNGKAEKLDNVETE
ncbi:MAG: hypothetical protein JXA69_14920 [Phycisphaerae bacterium]|nr:hypothetical protein [Phycisphaerae bacterium]